MQIGDVVTLVGKLMMVYPYAEGPVIDLSGIGLFPVKQALVVDFSNEGMRGICLVLADNVTESITKAPVAADSPVQA